MSNSKRGREDGDLGGFGILAAIALCCLIVGGLAYSNGVEGQRGEQYTAAYEKTAKANAIRSCSKINRATAVECIYEQIETSQNESRAEKDLQAQQGMKFWAAAVALLTLGTLIVTACGVWFVKQTLDATLDAVEDTGRATDAMLRQNEIAQDTARIQLRAYLNIIDPIIKVQYDGDVEIDTFQFTLKNHGQTPAGVILCSVIVRTFENEALDDLFRRKVKAGFTVAGNGSSMKLPIDMGNRIRVLEGNYNGPIIIHGVVLYNDIYGKECTTKFSFITDENFWDTYPDDYQMRTYHYDNEME